MEVLSSVLTDALPLSESKANPDDHNNLSSSSRSLGDRPGQPFLRLSVAPQHPTVISMRQVQEVLLLPLQRLTPMPNLPSCLLGLMNRGNRVFWLIDLGQLLGLGRLEENNGQYSVAIIQTEQTLLGLAVHQVHNMLWLEPDRIQSVPSYLTPHFANYLEGCLLQDKQVTWVLDITKVLTSPMLENLSNAAAV
jgi:positive phototaxis protein PixI